MNFFGRVTLCQLDNIICQPNKNMCLQKLIIKQISFRITDVFQLYFCLERHAIDMGHIQKCGNLRNLRTRCKYILYVDVNVIYA